MVLRSQIFFDEDFIRQYSPFFEILFSIELLISFFLLGVIPFLIIGVFTKKKIHRNIRIIISHIWLRYGSAIFGRLVLIYYQFRAISWTDSDTFFTIANIMRGSFTGYLTSFLCSIAFERLIATRFWSWYEKQGVSTISVALVSISIIEFLGQLAAYFYAYEILTIQQHYFLLSGYACGSAVCIFAVYWINIKIMKTLKRGARIDSYSINRTYQIKENLKVIYNLIYFVGPTALFNIPCFVFYGVYAFLPENFNTFRFFAAEFYDLFTVMYGLAYVVIMAFLQDRIKIIWIKFVKNSEFEIEKKVSETDIYFNQLNAQFAFPSTK